MKKTNKFFNKNFSTEVNELFEKFIRQEEDDLNRHFNYSRLRNLIEKLKIIPAAEQPEVLRKAISSDGWDWTEYLNL
jgi:hypothetical protein